MHERSDEDIRKQMSRILQTIKAEVREANGINSDEQLSPIERSTEQWLDLVSSFLSPLDAGTSLLENGQLMEMARRAMGDNGLSEILKQYLQQETDDQNS
jgi:hypothetical protein